MTSTPVPNLSRAAAGRPVITPTGWVWAAVLGGLFVLVHWIAISFMGRNAIGHLQDWGHILIVPAISAYYIFLKRDRLAELRPRLYWPGLIVLVIGVFAYMLAIYPARNGMAWGYATILTLFGLVLFTLGPAKMSVLWFPIAYLFFAVRVSQKVWDELAWQMQLVAAGGATIALKALGAMLGFEVHNDGSHITLGFLQQGAWHVEQVNVAEACSGLKMMMAFVALAVAIAFIWERPVWQRVVICLAAPPVAIFVNLIRVTVLGLLHVYAPALAQGDFHVTVVGLGMLVPAALIFLLIGWVMNKLFIPAEGGGSSGAEARGWLARHRVAATVAGVLLGLTAAWAFVLWVAIEVAVLAPNRTTAIIAIGVPGVCLVLAALGWLVHRWCGREPHTADAAVPMADRARVIATGVGGGAALIVLTGSIYLLVLAMLRPERVGGWLPVSPKLLLPVAGILMVGLAVALPRMIPARLRHIRRARLDYAMAVSAGLLVAAFVMQGRVIAAQKLVLFKEAVPLRHGLVELPSQAGTWELAGETKLPADQAAALGTDKYIDRTYIDTAWERGVPGWAARLHVAYYTGTIDTVPHVPERCFVGGGAKPEGTQPIKIDIDTAPAIGPAEAGGLLYESQVAGGPSRLPWTSIDAKGFSYVRDPVYRPELVEHVFYFFVANGRTVPSAESVRGIAFDPRDRYGYWCKVEISVPNVTDFQTARARANALLNEMLPEIMACLPDWAEVKAGTYPAEQDNTAPAR